MCNHIYLHKNILYVNTLFVNIHIIHTYMKIYTYVYFRYIYTYVSFIHANVRTYIVFIVYHTCMYIYIYTPICTTPKHKNKPAFRLRPPFVGGIPHLLLLKT